MNFSIEHSIQEGFIVSLFLTIRADVHIHIEYLTIDFEIINLAKNPINMHYKEDLVQETIPSRQTNHSKSFRKVADFPNLVRKNFAQRIRLG
jgi:hypothetical protein